MNIEILEKAKAKIPSAPILVNMVSLRFRELSSGQRPLIKPHPGEDRIDLVLREIAEGKMQSQYDFDALAKRGLLKK